MVGAITWLIIGLVNGFLFYYPMIMFVIGLIVLTNGIFKAAKKPLTVNKEELLDDDIV